MKNILITSLLTLIIVSTPFVLFAENPISETKSQENAVIQKATSGEIIVSGESRAFLDSDSAVIKIQIDTTAASATIADKNIETEIAKIQVNKDSELKIQKKSYLSGTSNPNELIKGSPIKLSTNLILMINNTTNLASTIDHILNINSAKILYISYRRNDKSESIKAAYANAVSNAKNKAEHIAKLNNLTIGSIIEISVNEELPPSSIRDQLQTSPDEVDSTPEEIRVFANVRFQLINK